MSNQSVNLINAEQSDKKLYFYQEICNRILSLELRPEAVLDEVALSKEFGLSRPPIREIMRQLAAEGYIELEANRPARVTSMNYQDIRGFYLAGTYLYTATSQLAALHATAQEIDELKQIQNHFQQAIAGQDADARSFYNRLFHQKIGFMAHNDYLMPSLNRVLICHARIGKIFYRYPAQTECLESWEAAIRHHDELIAAIEQHQTQEIEQIISEHMDLSRRCVIDYVMPPETKLSFSISNL